MNKDFFVKTLLLMGIFVGIASAQQGQVLVPVYPYPGPSYQGQTPVFYVVHGVPTATAAPAAAPGAAAPATGTVPGLPGVPGMPGGNAGALMNAGLGATPAGMATKALTGGGIPNPAGFFSGWFKQAPSQRNIRLRERREAKIKANSTKQKDWFSETSR